MTPFTAVRAEETNDTEITLGTGKMLSIFFGLVILCAVFFGMGFSMGKNSVKTGPELLPSPSASTGTRPSASPGKQAANSTPGPESKPAEQTQSPNANASGNAQSSSDQPPSVAPPSGVAYYVQVAAVTKQEDAEALVEALKGRQYSAFVANPSPDKFFHVQVGPFADIKEAEAMRSKLVSDGYNPILKK
jgi:DedD protein